MTVPPQAGLVLSSQQLDSHQNATVPHFRRDVDASGDRNSLTKQPVKGVSLDPPLRRQRLAPIGVTIAGGTQNSAVALEHANAEFVLVTPSSGGRLREDQSGGQADHENDRLSNDELSLPNCSVE